MWRPQLPPLAKPVAAMVALSGLPERSFIRRFTKAAGMTPLNYVHALRLEEAKQMLETTDLPIEAIANEAGYEDASFFGRLFRRETGLTPACRGRSQRGCGSRRRRDRHQGPDAGTPHTRASTPPSATAKLARVGGSVKKLTFSVDRTADIAAWAKRGEELLDARKPPFMGKGALQQAAAPIFVTAWEKGDAATISAAMSAFRVQFQEDLLAASKVPKADQAYRTWSRNFAQWLFSTDHISLSYSIDYDGIDITKLSPGTRGIVLLLLYLALDDADDRPLIIDQPEENLDPKSIFDELVGLFQAAKTKRQVIVVTHNANLVVNADADQIIIANVGPHPTGSLPPITYVSGGLHEAAIRRSVCDILEGGEKAFIERARRLRVNFDR